MHPHLNHLGSDICRGLLQFAQAKPLGDDGLYWLKVSVSLQQHQAVYSRFYRQRAAAPIALSFCSKFAAAVADACIACLKLCPCTGRKPVWRRCRQAADGQACSFCRRAD